MSSPREHNDSDRDSRRLDHLIEIYMQKIKELEEKEEKVMQQVELLQTSVAALQGKNEIQDTTQENAKPRLGLIDVEEVEIETQKIREETERIQMEILEKIMENKRLQSELDRRNNSIGAQSTSRKIDGVEAEKRTVETWSTPHPSVPPQAIESGIKFFSEKLEKLKKMEMNLKRASLEESELAKIRQMKLKEKIEMLEWETQVDRQLIDALKKKYGRK